MQIDLVGGAYKETIADLNPQRCLNWFPKYSLEKEGLKKDKILYPTPGFQLFSSISGTRVRGGFCKKDQLFVVVDNLLYEISYTATATLRGTMTASANRTTRVYLEMNTSDQLFIGDGPYGYVYNTGTGVFAQI